MFYAVVAYHTSNPSLVVHQSFAIGKEAEDWCKGMVQSCNIYLLEGAVYRGWVLDSLGNVVYTYTE